MQTYIDFLDQPWMRVRFSGLTCLIAGLLSLSLHGWSLNGFVNSFNSITSVTAVIFGLFLIILTFYKRRQLEHIIKNK